MYNLNKYIDLGYVESKPERLTPRSITFAVLVRKHNFHIKNNDDISWYFKCQQL